MVRGYCLDSDVIIWQLRNARQRTQVTAQLASLEAPDFTLPDLDGNLHSLSNYRGRKVLLATYGSW